MVFYAHDRAFACELGAIQSILPDPTLGQNTSTRLNTAAPTTGP
jgi:hypothetical protein